MEATIFRIRKHNGKVVMEGLVENVYSKIYPNSNIKDSSLPYQVELRHFYHKDYSIEYHDIDIPWDVAMGYKV